MTVSTTTSRVSYTGDGVVTVFNFSFKILQTTDLDVYVDDVLQTTGVAVVIDSSGVGGTVTFGTAPADDAVVLLVRDVPFTQATSLQTEGDLPETTLENAFDKLTMLCQQLDEQNDRGLVLPVTSTKSGEFANEPTSTLVLPVWDPVDEHFEFVSVATAFSEAEPAAGGGNVTGPGTSTDYSVVVYNGTTGLTLREGAPLGVAETVFISNGVGVAPTWKVRNFFFKSTNITASLRALPTSGALSGTYVHFGDWTSTGALTFAHDTRIYLNGNFTLSHTLTGTAQSNGGTCGANHAFSGGPGGGPGGGQPGYAIHGAAGLGGGAGGGCGGAGGRGGYNGAASANMGGRAHGVMTAGGSGGGAGSGDLGGTNLGQAGGGGGGFLYLEVTGAITLNETISATGTAGTVATTTGGAGGGGAGGVIVIRASGALTIATGKKVTCNGGAGGNENTNGRGGGGGGGGIVDIWTGGTHTLPDTAAVHVTATAGAAGSGTPTTAPAAGSAGTTTLLASAAPISLF